MPATQAVGDHPPRPVIGYSVDGRKSKRGIIMRCRNRSKASGGLQAGLPVLRQSPGGPMALRTSGPRERDLYLRGSVLSQKFVGKISPRRGRHNLAHGGSRGQNVRPYPLPPLPPRRERAGVSTFSQRTIENPHPRPLGGEGGPQPAPSPAGAGRVRGSKPDVLSFTR